MTLFKWISGMEIWLDDPNLGPKKDIFGLMCLAWMNDYGLD